MDVYDIIKKHLVDNGFDGLCYTGDKYAPCGCDLTHLMQCIDWEGEPCSCSPGYKVTCDCDGDPDNDYGYPNHHYHIALKKNKKVGKTA